MDYVNILKRQYGIKEFTKENVNNILGSSERTILDYVVVYDDLYEKYIPWLLLLGAKVTAKTLYYTRWGRVEFILEQGLDVTTISMDSAALYFDETILYTLIDWDVKAPTEFKNFCNRAPVIIRLKEYASLSNTRVQECRKALLTTIYACNLSNFRALREILLCAVRQMWCMKGGEGVGPRGHGWVLKPIVK